MLKLVYYDFVDENQVGNLVIRYIPINEKNL